MCSKQIFVWNDNANTYNCVFSLFSYLEVKEIIISWFVRKIRIRTFKIDYFIWGTKYIFKTLGISCLAISKSWILLWCSSFASPGRNWGRMPIPQPIYQNPTRRSYHHGCDLDFIFGKRSHFWLFDLVHGLNQTRTIWSC